MVTARLGGKKTVAVKGVDGVMWVQELLQRITVSLGMAVGAKAALRCEARWLKADETLAEAGVASGDVVDVWVGEEGGMPTAAPDTSRRVAELELALLDLDTKVCWIGVEEKAADPTGHIMIGRIGLKDSIRQTRIVARIANGRFR